MSGLVGEGKFELVVPRYAVIDRAGNPSLATRLQLQRDVTPPDSPILRCEEGAVVSQAQVTVLVRFGEPVLLFGRDSIDVQGRQGLTVGGWTLVLCLLVWPCCVPLAFPFCFFLTCVFLCLSHVRKHLS